MQRSATNWFSCRDVQKFHIRGACIACLSPALPLLFLQNLWLPWLRALKISLGHDFWPQISQGPVIITSRQHTLYIRKDYTVYLLVVGQITQKHGDQVTKKTQNSSKLFYIENNWKFKILESFFLTVNCIWRKFYEVFTKWFPRNSSRKS